MRHGNKPGAGPKSLARWRPTKRSDKALNEAVAESRHNPETARSLFAVASYGRRDPASLEELRVMFAKEGIPMEFLSLYVPNGPFACLSLNDGLSDKF